MFELPVARLGTHSTLLANTCPWTPVTGFMARSSPRGQRTRGLPHFPRWPHFLLEAESRDDVPSTSWKKFSGNMYSFQKQGDFIRSFCEKTGSELICHPPSLAYFSIFSWHSIPVLLWLKTLGWPIRCCGKTPTFGQPNPSALRS